MTTATVPDEQQHTLDEALELCGFTLEQAVKLERQCLNDVEDVIDEILSERGADRLLVGLLVEHGPQRSDLSDLPVSIDPSELVLEIAGAGVRLSQGLGEIAKFVKARKRYDTACSLAARARREGRLST